MLKIFLFVLLGISLASCEKAEEKRRYEEIVIKPETSSMMGAMHKDSHATMEDPHAMMGDVGSDPHAMLGVMGGDAGSDPHAMMGAVGGDPHAFMRDMPGAGAGGMGAMSNMAPNDAIMASVAPAALSWATPDGWQEKAGGGMRVATFVVGDASDKAECSIISLGAQAGTLKANAARWAAQIQVSVDDSALDKFLAAQTLLKTQDGASVQLVDLASLQDKENGEAPSMIASVISYPDKTIFIKLTGPKRIVLQNSEKFKSFCQTLKSKN